MILSWESLVYCNSVIIRFSLGLLIRSTILQNDLGKPVENQQNHKTWCLVKISDSRINNFCHRRRLVEMIPAILSVLSLREHWPDIPRYLAAEIDGFLKHFATSDPSYPNFTHPKSGEFSGHVIGWRRLLSSHSFTGGPSKTPKISWLGLDQRWAVAIKERPFGDLLDFNPPTHNWYISVSYYYIIHYKYWFYTLDMHDRSWQHVRRSLLNRPAHRRSHLRADHGAGFISFHAGRAIFVWQLKQCKEWTGAIRQHLVPQVRPGMQIFRLLWAGSCWYYHPLYIFTLPAWINIFSLMLFGSIWVGIDERLTYMCLRVCALARTESPKWIEKQHLPMVLKLNPAIRTFPPPF